MRRLYATLIFSLFALSQLVAQGTMHKQNGHFIAQLDFFNNHPFKDTKGRIPHPLPLTTNGLKNTSEVWYEEKGVKVKGLIQSAAMQVDWWLLFGEPTEQYEFQWVSSGYYDIVFTDKKGKAINTRISKDNLAKYPDLLKRFNNLAPIALDFEISWRIGSQTDADREAFKQRYNLLGSIGSSMPHVNTNFKTTVKNSGLLFEPSGIKPFAVPGIGGGKGRDYLGLAANYDETKLSQIFAYWKISTGQVIQNFSATKNDWPIDEMKAIAEKYLAYENGEEEPTPKEEIAKADEINKNTKAYAKDDFWGDAVEERKLNIKHSDVDGLTIGDKNIPNKDLGLNVAHRQNEGTNNFSKFNSLARHVGEADQLASILEKEKLIAFCTRYIEKQGQFPKFILANFKGEEVLSINSTEKYGQFGYLYLYGTPYLLLLQTYNNSYGNSAKARYLIDLKTLKYQEIASVANYNIDGGFVIFDFVHPYDGNNYAYGMLGSIGPFGKHTTSDRYNKLVSKYSGGDYKYIIANIDVAGNYNLYSIDKNNQWKFIESVKK